jgi:methylmalonyl-CoA/ethylmalonyl-CoA epimerase
VDNLTEVVKKLKEHGIAPLAPPKIGAHGLPVIFVHPKYCSGVLTEFQENPSAPPK